MVGLSCGLRALPAAAVLDDEAIGGEAGQHAVQVVLLDAHLLGDLGDRDPGVGGDELERLLGARAAALRTAAALAVRSAASAWRGLGGGVGGVAVSAAAGRRRAGGGGETVERRCGGFEPRVLVDQRLELLQALADLAALLIKKFCMTRFL